MMGSSHLDHYHQEELHGFSSLATVPAFYDLASNREHWNVQNQLIQNCSDFISNGNGVQSAGHRDFSCLSHEEIPPVSLQMIQEIGFHGAAGNNEEGFMNQLQSHPNQLNLGKVKEESPENCFLKLFRDHSSEEYYQLHEKLFVRALASDCLQSDGLRPLPGNLPENPSSFDGYGGGRDHNNFSRMAFPAANLLHLSPLHPPPSVISGLLDMDLQALDLLASARLGRSLCQPSLAGMALIREDAISSGFDHLQDSIQGPFYHHHLKMPSLVSGVTEASRSTCQAAAPLRKPRFDQRPSFSPFKVRKEKLGDRIAALQQLVAPFGKTDTASVLMEAIGYIKFLLDQVEKLSVPYMGSSGNKRSRTMTEGSNEDSDEPRRDLRSRGLCLVPLSCTSYMTTEHGVWSPIE